MQDPTPIADSFSALAERFESIYRYPDPDPCHVAVSIQRYTLQAGRLLLRAADKGLFAGMTWWKGDSLLAAGTFRDDDDRAGFIWAQTMLWLCAAFRAHMPRKGADLDWKHYVRDLKHPDAWGCRESQYTDAQAHAHTRARAAVQADACRLFTGRVAIAILPGR